jgi:hypothetical protein
LTEYDSAVFAAKYVDLCQAGESGIHETLADLFGITPANSRQRIHRAREKSLLMGGQQGRAGGYLSDKAIQLLNPDNTDDQPP